METESVGNYQNLNGGAIPLSFCKMGKCFFVVRAGCFFVCRPGSFCSSIRVFFVGREGVFLKVGPGGFL